MKVISTTVEYKGYPVKAENGRVFLKCFGTTIHNHLMHWSWVEVSTNNLKPELYKLLKEKRLL